jgi:hypothetical protein
MARALLAASCRNPILKKCANQEIFMASPSTGFSSVKLPAALVQQAREAAQPLRRSVAGQVEYWATLGRIADAFGSDGAGGAGGDRGL